MKREGAARLSPCLYVPLKWWNRTLQSNSVLHRTLHQLNSASTGLCISQGGFFFALVVKKQGTTFSSNPPDESNTMKYKNVP